MIIMYYNQRPNLLILQVLSLKLIKMLKIYFIEIIDKNLIVLSSNLKTYIKEI